MGDHTSVCLTFQKEHLDTVLAIYLYSPEEAYASLEKGLYYLNFDDVNYGNLHHLDKLEAAGIAYDSCWGPGDEYGEGTRYCRFTDKGELVILDLYDDDANPDMDCLLVLIDKPVELRQFILDHQAARSIIGWENQVEYGKLYQMHQLLV